MILWLRTPMLSQLTSIMTKIVPRHCREDSGAATAVTPAQPS
jgi:hypothetical protein